MKVAARLTPRGFSKIPRLLADVDEFFDRIFWKIDCSAKGFCEDRYLRRVFERLEPIESLPEIFAVSDGAVVRHQKRVVMFDERPHRFRELVCRRRSVIGQRNAAKRENDF